MKDSILQGRGNKQDTIRNMKIINRGKSLHEDALTDE